MKKLLIVIIFSIFVIFALIFWWNNMLLPVNPMDKASSIFVVNKGDTVREITYNLKTKGFIKNPIVFFLLLKKLGLDKQIQAGDFRLSPSMTAEDIAQNLTHGILDIWITIPEGKRAEEIAEILQKELATYDPSWQSILKSNEGYLFPDTYLIPKDADIKIITALMLDNFEKKFSEITQNINSPLSKEDSVILASLIEREARFPQDRPLVASVMLNRLNIGMKLDIDATVQYALGYQEDKKTWWKKDLTLDDLKINSLYNTYVHAGLPPKPIANPGVASLQAALNPANTEYFYYISDKTGHNHYAKTILEHNANIKKYL
ncbi:MAG: hypothetical protein A3D74_00480 [Candidatus Levybacteria bacterium RIFCSPHIGHO2_02_FULL_37_13]|nr:MAG: hypothetical protein A3D74_00480 [Candidatus Levybacteria bacterium RIFCSPHIGHO2_02_FULL_37_13]OGH29529.1 MAG: hypothetical protein A3E40_00405 [Candidatus Levybacteria bacterium RIFCSPHIGHO2_12_FULL_37_9]OGH39677.1 MAG: hypothetical protein A3B41_00955 [Candidatus Levybacteria bacterium RIFCSPLOWO2_01_FULL_37_26]